MNSRSISIFVLTADSADRTFSGIDIDAIKSSVQAESGKIVLLTFDKTWSDEQLQFLADKFYRSTLNCIHISGKRSAFITEKSILDSLLLPSLSTRPTTLFSELMTKVLHDRLYRAVEISFESINFTPLESSTRQDTSVVSPPVARDICYEFEMIPFIKSLPVGAIEE